MSFDVTADVRRLVGGDPDYANGWIVKGSNGLLSGVWINFASRETDTPPKLVLKLVPNVVPDPDVLFVTSESADASAMRDRMLALGYDTTTKTASEVNGDPAFRPQDYSLIVLVDDGSLAASALQEIGDSGVAVLVLLEGTSATYPAALELTTATMATCDSASPLALTANCHEITLPMFESFDAYTGSGQHCALCVEDFAPGAISLVTTTASSSSCAEDSIFFVHATRRAAFMGLPGAEVFSNDSWILFDQAIDYLLPFSASWHGEAAAWHALESSGVLNALAEVEATPDPASLDYGVAEAEVWRGLYQADLAFLRHWASQRLSWYILQGQDPGIEQFEISSESDLLDYIHGGF